MAKSKDLTGAKFGMLKVISQVKTGPGKGTKWNCLCDCKKTVVRSASALGKNKNPNCGCIRQGQRKTRLYGIWANMKQRCTNPSNPAYPYYGAKGISICDEWANDFLAFQSWALKNGYDDSLTIDRVDGNKNYQPDNCRWSTRKEQSNNLSSNTVIVFEGKEYTLTQLAEEYGLDPKLVIDRHKLGWPAKDLVKPVFKANTIDFLGEQVTIKQLSEQYGIHQRTLRSRYKAGDRNEKLIRSV